MSRYLFIVVGVGGTGSLLARDLPKLLINTKHKLCLVDNDIVERKNMLRQGYQEQDIGLNKAIALSRKINSLYHTECTFVDAYATYDNLMKLISDYKAFVPIIIGCVDNNATRLIFEKVVKDIDNCIYIDSANSEYEGNIYVVYKIDSTQYGKMRSQIYNMEKDLHPDEQSCQELSADGNVQYLVTNAKMAVGILEHCNAILEGRLKEGVNVVRRFETVFFG